jgi:putative DNA primase/helicase
MNSSPSNAIENFRAALRKSGLEFDGAIVSDGKLHRFKASGDNNKNSWYVLHSGSPAAGAFGCWKRGLKETFCERNGELSQAEWNEVRCRWREAERERERAETECHKKARKIS